MSCRQLIENETEEQAETFIAEYMNAGLEDWDYPDCLERVG